MTYDNARFTRQTSAFNAGQISTKENPASATVLANGPRFFSYATADDTISEVKAANYFADEVNNLAVDDIIMCVASDASEFVQVATVSPSAGTITVTPFTASASVDTANLVNGAVTNAKVNAAAAIDYSKLATLTDGNILVGSAGNVCTSVAMSGDATIINTGAVTVSSSLIQTATVDISAALFKGLYATPQQLVGAGGANTQIILHQALFFLDYGSAQYTGGGAVHIQYDNTGSGAGTKASGTIANTGINAATADSSWQLSGTQAVAATSTTINKGLFLSNASADFADGDSPVKVAVWYSVADLS